LAQLADDASAVNVYVFDAWSHVWCTAMPVAWIADTFDAGMGERPVGTRAVEILDTALRRLEKPLPRGGTLAARVGEAYLRSFATVYVLMLRFAHPFELEPLRALVDAALPDIARLTTALPPPGGPGGHGTEAVGTA
jgi:hypothetical protein